MKYNTLNLIQELENRIESILVRAVSDWQTTDESGMTFSTNHSSWNALQCLMHLNSYGNYYLPAIEKTINTHKKSESLHSFKSTWLGNYFYVSMLPEQQGKKMKKMKS